MYPSLPSVPRPDPYDFYAYTLQILEDQSDDFDLNTKEENKDYKFLFYKVIKPTDWSQKPDLKDLVINISLTPIFPTMWLSVL